MCFITSNAQEVISDTSNGPVRTILYRCDDGSLMTRCITVCASCFGGKTCYMCHGSGVLYNLYGPYPCVACFGSGQCKFCNGVGYKESVFYTPKVEINSENPSVGTYPTFPENNSMPSSTTNGSSSVRCKGCNGTGHCTMCKGKGWYKNIYDSKSYDCPSCGGSGRCGVCFGKGVIN